MEKQRHRAVPWHQQIPHVGGEQLKILIFLFWGLELLVVMALLELSPAPSPQTDSSWSPDPFFLLRDLFSVLRTPFLCSRPFFLARGPFFSTQGPLFCAQDPSSLLKTLFLCSWTIFPCSAPPFFCSQDPFSLLRDPFSLLRTQILFPSTLEGSQGFNIRAQEQSCVCWEAAPRAILPWALTLGLELCA